MTSSVDGLVGGVVPRVDLRGCSSRQVRRRSGLSKPNPEVHFLYTPDTHSMDTHCRWVLELEAGFSPPNCEVGLGLHEHLSASPPVWDTERDGALSFRTLTWDPTALVRRIPT